MRRQLRIAVIDRTSELVTFQVVKQTHREGRFAADGERFESADGFVIASRCVPQVVGEGGRKAYGGIDCFVRGGDDHADGRRLSMVADRFAQMEAAVEEYNDSNGGEDIED